ncbi:MAG: GGDEF domain-containing protein [Alphaproteobacteria bacterium]|nr:GGDEF domain-containing protein [Alphaproteobacteria bacterium]
MTRKTLPLSSNFSTSNFSAVVASLSGPALDTFPGPVLLLGVDGAVVAANAWATGLAAEIQDNAEFLAVARLAARENTTTRHQAEIPAPDGGGMMLLDLVLLPTHEGQGVLILGHDKTLEANLRTALVDSRQRYKDLVEISSDFVWECDAEGKFVFVSGKGVLGYQAEGLIGGDSRSFLAEPLEPDRVSPFQTHVPVEQMELWLRRADGHLACVVTAATPLFGADGSWLGARGICRDITGEREREAVMANARNRDRLLSRIVRVINGEIEPENVLATAAIALTRSVPESGCQIFRLDPQRQGGTSGYPSDNAFFNAAHAGNIGGDAAVQPVLVSFQAGGAQVEITAGEWQILAAATRFERVMNGCVCLWRRTDHARWLDDERILVAAIADHLGLAIAKVAKHAMILNLSRTDGLTGLLNRRAFMEDLKHHYPRFRREQKPAALMYVDLDNFKLVNDSHGHLRGDEALIRVKDLLVGVTRATDLVARLGGDEFALWLDGADASVAQERARVLLERGAVLRDYSGSDDRPLQMSIGIAAYDPSQPESLEELVARADAAMYAVKRTGKGQFQIAPPAQTPLAS